MATDNQGVLPLGSEHDIVASRQHVRGLCQALKFSLVDQTKMVTATSELSRNTLIHGHGGRMHWILREQNGWRGLELVFEDEGPGIADLKLALSDGWTSGSGMGLGLPGSKRLVNELDIQPAPGRGARVGIVKWK
ncbi:anti-sigma regulatory factor [Variovorax sp. J22R24]|uniref:anti-sigma regulatory factor n=1 Tax=Variovorax gracilis TaxID=3053502 RepID=UPI0025773F09|nr:anti-sigma regulatory factor [Variovorax sp. J22R24]MDM0110114.1 anti-sigma regulatory factor [Variovorax sp. J22R24]